MCGIFGIIVNENSSFNKSVLPNTLNELFRLSESRGKEAAGIALLSSDRISIYKQPIPASSMIRRKEYKALFAPFEEARGGNGKNVKELVVAIGHSRLVTNGSQQEHTNNQPVISSDIVGIHNGIITNADNLWKEFSSLERHYQIDTEVLLSLIRKFYNETGCLITSVQEAYKFIEGAASIATLFVDLDSILLATNNGSLYMVFDKPKLTAIFASERYIIHTLLKKNWLNNHFSGRPIQHIEAGSGLLLSLKNSEHQEFQLTVCKDMKEWTAVKPEILDTKKEISDVTPANKSADVERIRGEGPYILVPTFIDEFPVNRERVAQLRRCTKCVLPETMPYIEFNEEGLCNYCRSYKKREYLGLDALKEQMEPYRKKNGEPDCLITFSGGRDSSYGVHFFKKVLGLNPVTYTYDWGMVTDLARRNQMRICGKLGVEHILVSADINKKRSNIRKNVSAWLKRPYLGTVPLFMAGDKQYFYYANKVGQQIGCKIVVLCENMLETTKFKSGYCGIKPRHNEAHTYTLSLIDKAKMSLFYGKQYLMNPAYINGSILDTIFAFCCYYFIPHNYVNLYDYVKWDERIINKILIEEYNWETAVDTDSTWRIGDGTASFYNYIYYTMSGLTENDTFRSNQIREGILSRTEALKLVERDNRPRYESIQWYCDIIDIDFGGTIKLINKAPKLY